MVRKHAHAEGFDRIGDELCERATPVFPLPAPPTLPRRLLDRDFTGEVSPVLPDSLGDAEHL
jgi:hypothetical protein